MTERQVRLDLRVRRVIPVPMVQSDRKGFPALMVR